MTAVDSTFPAHADLAELGIDARRLERLGWIGHRKGIRRRGWLVRRMLLLADAVGLVAAFLLAESLVAAHQPAAGQLDTVVELILFFVSLPAWIVTAKLYGLYDKDEERADHSTADEVGGVFHMITVGTWLFFALSYVMPVVHPDFPKLLVFWALAVVFVSCGRAAVRAVCRRQPDYVQNTIIVGAGDVGQVIGRKLLNHPEYGINLLGFVDDTPKERRADLADLTLLGAQQQLPELVPELDVERVIFAFSNDPHEQTLDLIRSLKEFDVQVDLVPRLFDLVGPNVGMHNVEGLPLVGLPPARLSRSSKLLKRTVDLIGSALGLVLLAPAFAVIALLVKVTSPGPVFFRQVRMGYGNRTFRIFKFRTMTADADERKREVAHLNKHLQNGGDPRMFKIPRDPRITRAGRFLRRYSLDELPQLINVIVGEMSLVGPRPLILNEDEHIERWGRRRLNLKPGITGPWQVMGRSEIPFEEMVRLDYLYVTGWSLFSDLKLIFRTFPALLRTGQ
jgi:exopolysaccharide biosynthesis polyprenyl glycosylphosphotransferase